MKNNLYKCITVKELLSRLNSYINKDKSRLNDKVMIVDDWYPPRYYNVNSAIGSIFDREVKSEKIKTKKVKVKQDVMTFGNYHWEDNNGNDCGPGQGHIVSNSPIYEEIEKEIPYQESPPEYKKENVFLIVTDLYKEEK